MSLLPHADKNQWEEASALRKMRSAQQVMANSEWRPEGDSHHPSNIPPAIAGAGLRLISGRVL